MSENNHNNFYYSFVRPVLKVFFQFLFFIFLAALALFLFFYFFHNPVREFIDTFGWYISSDSIKDINAIESKQLAHLMSKRYILSTNDLLSQVGSFYSYTITILIFFCTISAFFAVLVIKINADDKFDTTISSKVKYFFDNDKNFDNEVKRRISGLFAEEGEQTSGIDEKNEDIFQLKDEIRKLKVEVSKLKGALFSGNPSESDVDTEAYLQNMMNTLQDGKEATITDENNENGNP